MKSMFMADPFAATAWRPAVDIYHSRGEWLLKFDLAGVRLQELEITVSGRQLTVCGVRRDWSVLADQRCYSMEIAYNRFQRSVELPCELDEMQLSTEYRDGMLFVRLLPRERAG